MAAATVYDVGDAAWLIAAFRAATLSISTATGLPSTTEALADPTTVTLELTAPSGTPTTYTYPASITKSATGLYYKLVTWTEAGEWRAKWAGTGTVAQTDSEVYTVQDQGG
jgi:hypothetical protein